MINRTIYQRRIILGKNANMTKIHKLKMPLNVECADSSILLPSFSIDLRMPRSDVTVRIGENSMIGCTCIFESDSGRIDIGNRTFINGGTRLISKNSIVIGNDVTIAWGCYIYDHNSHSLDWRMRAKDIAKQCEDYRACGNFIKNKDWSTVKNAPIYIGDKVWIGFDALIMKGVCIGEGAIVGAKSVVTKNVEPWTVVAGNPAKTIRRLKIGGCE